MVAMKLATIAVLATVAVAAPTTAVTTTTEAKPFSFSKWVDDIINPDVVALTPEQAVEAYYQSINATTSTHDGAVKAKRWDKFTCFTEDQREWRPDVDAAVKCVSGLAALGSSVHYTVMGGSNSLRVCHDIPGVEMAAISSYYHDIDVTTQDFAVAGGHIMDRCTWAGRTGGATFEDTHPQLELNLQRR